MVLTVAWSSLLGFGGIRWKCDLPPNTQVGPGTALQSALAVRSVSGDQMWVLCLLLHLLIPWDTQCYTWTEVEVGRCTETLVQ